MSGAEDFLEAVRKVVGDKPLFLIAGASDLVNEKLRDLPERFNSVQSEYKEFPMRAAGALVGQAFKANLKLGEFYEDLTRRGEEAVAKMRGDTVYAEEDEPFVREPFMPEPVHPSVAAAPGQKAAGKKAAAKRTPGQQAAGKKAAAKRTPGQQAARARKAAPRRPRPGSSS